jgi:hypothetical protein
MRYFVFVGGSVRTRSVAAFVFVVVGLFPGCCMNAVVDGVTELGGTHEIRAVRSACVSGDGRTLVLETHVGCPSNVDPYRRSEVGTYFVRYDIAPETSAESIGADGIERIASRDAGRALPVVPLEQWRELTGAPWPQGSPWKAPAALPHDYLVLATHMLPGQRSRVIGLWLVQGDSARALGTLASEREALAFAAMPVWVPIYLASGVADFALLPAYGLYLVAGYNPATGARIAWTGFLEWRDRYPPSPLGRR